MRLNPSLDSSPYAVSPTTLRPHPTPLTSDPPKLGSKLTELTSLLPLRPQPPLPKRNSDIAKSVHATASRLSRPLATTEVRPSHDAARGRAYETQCSHGLSCSSSFDRERVVEEKGQGLRTAGVPATTCQSNTNLCSSSLQTRSRPPGTCGAAKG